MLPSLLARIVIRGSFGPASFFGIDRSSVFSIFSMSRDFLHLVCCARGANRRFSQERDGAQRHSVNCLGDTKPVITNASISLTLAFQPVAAQAAAVGGAGAL